MPDSPEVRRREIRRWQQRRRRQGRWARRLAPLGVVAVASGLVVAVAPVAQGPAEVVTATVDLVDRDRGAASRSATRDEVPTATPAATPTASATAAPTPAPTQAPAAAPTVTPEPAAAPPAPDPAPEAAPAPAAGPAPRAQEPAAAPRAAAAAPSAPADAMAARIVELTNAERRAAGLGDLAVSACAAQQALQRTAVLVAQGRFEHDPLQPIVAACGVGTVGENLSLGYRTAEAAVTGWMGSSGHRANILRTSYRQIGVGCTEGPRGWLCAQVFLG
ncbi:CAP domain-containing protein [Cellulomonas sp. JZ18]|uniref:CAP domain-containing protein n=1 Tax=Cellulomonas sp. JZ18 TaxID=2654191 RepID=UPI0012D3E915|nr:CAP domain-containing protein [Cellulomonas sp. JZ18]QGQ20268.1 CAP domain-containing protein [Cellulomonas sp. JZ18]